MQLALPHYHMQCALDGGLLNRFPQLQRLDLSWNSISGRWELVNPSRLLLSLWSTQCLKW